MNLYVGRRMMHQLTKLLAKIHEMHKNKCLLKFVLKLEWEKWFLLMYLHLNEKLSNTAYFIQSALHHFHMKGFDVPVISVMLHATNAILCQRTLPILNYYIFINATAM
jgi:hypothetical protein